jgi:lipopolysaccharide transport system ATP-binding protein
MVESTPNAALLLSHGRPTGSWNQAFAFPGEAAQGRGFLQERMTPANQNLFHVTHAKAGSTWIADILSTAFGERTFRRFGRRTEHYEWASGRVYPAIFLPREEFFSLAGTAEQPVFFVLRDIRDAMVSLYFSLRYTHTTEGFPHIVKFREEVAGMSDGEGLLHTLRTRHSEIQRIQESWLESGSEVVRYEDLIASGGSLLTEVFDRIGFSYDREILSRAIAANSFEAKFGRALGEVDERSHGRQGLPGDWRRYATDELVEFTETTLRGTLEKGGYSLS